MLLHFYRIVGKRENPLLCVCIYIFHLIDFLFIHLSGRAQKTGVILERWGAVKAVPAGDLTFTPKAFSFFWHFHVSNANEGCIRGFCWEDAAAFFLERWFWCVKYIFGKLWWPRSGTYERKAIHSSRKQVIQFFLKAFRLKFSIKWKNIIEDCGRGSFELSQ